MKKPGGDGSQALTAIYTCEILRQRVDLLNDIYSPGRTSLGSEKNKVRGNKKIRGTTKQQGREFRFLRRYKWMG